MYYNEYYLLHNYNNCKYVYIRISPRNTMTDKKKSDKQIRTNAKMDDLDEETISEIRDMIRNHIVTTMIQEDEYGNWIIDMVTADDAQ